MMMFRCLAAKARRLGGASHSVFAAPCRENSILVNSFVYNPLFQNDSCVKRFKKKIQQQLQSRRTTSSTTTNNEKENILRVAIVGSGPSGCYTAKYLLQQHKKEHDSLPAKKLSIDVIEELPTPFGLVRSGVAPDHPNVKNVQNEFSHLFESHADDAEQQQQSLKLYANVKVGRDVSLLELRRIYHIVVLAYGCCDSDRKLSIPGEDNLEGVLSAREFVAWYNGHLHYSHVGNIISNALSSKESNNNNEMNELVPAKVVVIGNGNVALDCARILTKGGKGLYDSDLAARALNILRGGIQEVVILGRRSHVQAAFTIAELRELTKLNDTRFELNRQDLELATQDNEASRQTLQSSRQKARIDKLLFQQLNKQEKKNDDDEKKKEKRIQLRFLLNPVAFHSSNNRLSSITVERTRLETRNGNETIVAVGTGEMQTIQADLALVSIGYKGVAIPGLEPFFDDERGIVRHNGMGKVDSANENLGGLYVSGWLKRGPTGIIGTNTWDSKHTVEQIWDDLSKQNDESLFGKKETNGLESLLQERNIAFVDWSAYERIDAAETSRKRSPTQPREKIVDLEEMLQVAFSKENK